MKRHYRGRRRTGFVDLMRSPVGGDLGEYGQLLRDSPPADGSVDGSVLKLYVNFVTGRRGGQRAATGMIAAPAVTDDPFTLANQL